MQVIQKSDGDWAVVHAGREVDVAFASEGQAWDWADEFIDDQVRDTPNWLADPLTYRTPVGTTQ